MRSGMRGLQRKFRGMFPCDFDHEFRCWLQLLGGFVESFTQVCCQIGDWGKAWQATGFVRLLE